MEGWISGQAKQSHEEIAGAAFTARRFLAGPICALTGLQKPSSCLPKRPQTHPPAPPTVTRTRWFSHLRHTHQGLCQNAILQPTVCAIVNHDVLQYSHRFLWILTLKTSNPQSLSPMFYFKDHNVCNIPLFHINSPTYLSITHNQTAFPDASSVGYTVAELISLSVQSILSVNKCYNSCANNKASISNRLEITITSCQRTPCGNWRYWNSYRIVPLYYNFSLGHHSKSVMVTFLLTELIFVAMLPSPTVHTPRVSTSNLNKEVSV